MAHAADCDVSASIRCVEGGTQRIVTGIAAICNLDDLAEEFGIEFIGGQIKGLGWGIQGHHHLVGVGQSGHDCNFHALGSAGLDQISPVGQVSSDFPLAIRCSGRKARALLTDDIFQGSVVLGVDDSIGIIVFQSFVRANDVIFGIPAMKAGAALPSPWQPAQVSN